MNTAINSLLLFGSSFIAVLLFGFQSQIVRDKHKKMAFFTSLCIGCSQLVFFKYVPGATPIEALFWILGGSCGIVASIEVHNVWLRYFPKHNHIIGSIDGKTGAIIVANVTSGKIRPADEKFDQRHPAYIASIDD